MLQNPTYSKLLRENQQGWRSKMNRFSMLLHRFITTFWINEDILKNSNLSKNSNTHESRNRGRNRNVIWYNPLFSKNVKTNIAKQFLHLLDKHFGRNHKYHKILNRNNVKISYSCMDKMTNIISIHNKNVTNSDSKTNGKTYNCWNKSNCPLGNKCLTNKIAYSLKTRPTMTSMSYQQKFVLVSVRQNLRPDTTNKQCHLETGYRKMILNFRNTFGV